MRFLVLGGTRFLGRHFVDAALARDHDVAVFTRGNLPLPWRSGVRVLVGNRDPRIEPGLGALADGTWDAVVDTSGYVPRIVSASAELLASRVSRYLFVSTISVYASTDRPGLDEAAPVAKLDEPATEEVLKHYGALKAACEAAVARRYEARTTIVRPGLIVGPHDATDRFGYWVARFVHPSLLGDRPRQAVVPASRDRPIQFIDARDLAEWMVALIERDTGGTFNACSPARQWTMGDLCDALAASSSTSPQPVWADDATLATHGVEPWVGLPLWLPASEPDAAGFMSVDCERAKAAGLRTRALTQTIADTAQWLATRDNAGAWKNALGAETERRILESILRQR